MLFYPLTLELKLKYKTHFNFIFSGEPVMPQAVSGDSTDTVLKDIRNQLSKLSRRSMFKTLIPVLFLIIAGVQIFLWLGKDTNAIPDKPHIALIKIEGVIGPNSKYGDAIKLVTALEKARVNPNVKAILIEANSGGGSPVHAEIVSNAIDGIRKSGKEVLFSIGELCASACLYIGSQANEIFVHRNSLVGSVGVKIEGWGVDRLLNEVGVDRRSYSKGDHKGFLDPFQPEDKVVANHVNEMILTPLYREFIRVLKEGRGDKLSDDPRALSGLVWSGSEAIELGLADTISDSWSLRESLKKEYNLQDVIAYNKKRVRVRDLLTSEFYAEVISHALVNVSESAEATVTY